MKIRIDSCGFEATEALYEHTEQQVKRLGEAFPLNHATVTLAVERDGEPVVEVSIQGEEIDLRFEERGTDLYGAVPRIVERIEQRLRRSSDSQTIF